MCACATGERNIYHITEDLLEFYRPDLVIRAARHYEGAEQILRRRAVLTAREVRYIILHQLVGASEVAGDGSLELKISFSTSV